MIHGQGPRASVLGRPIQWPYPQNRGKEAFPGTASRLMAQLPLPPLWTLSSLRSLAATIRRYRMSFVRPAGDKAAQQWRHCGCRDSHHSSAPLGRLHIRVPREINFSTRLACRLPPSNQKRFPPTFCCPSLCGPSDVVPVEGRPRAKKRYLLPDDQPHVASLLVHVTSHARH